MKASANFNAPSGIEKVSPWSVGTSGISMLLNTGSALPAAVTEIFFSPIWYPPLGSTVPPRAVAIICAPRQTPKTGLFWSNAFLK